MLDLTENILYKQEGNKKIIPWSFIFKTNVTPLDGALISRLKFTVYPSENLF